MFPYHQKNTDYLHSDHRKSEKHSKTMEKQENPGILNIDTSLYKTRISASFANRKSCQPADPHIITSFIPGTILDILVKTGQSVKKGDDLMILDAMKMQNVLRSSVDGRIKTIAVNKGDKVSKGFILLELELNLK